MSVSRPELLPMALAAGGGLLLRRPAAGGLARRMSSSHASRGRAAVRAVDVAGAEAGDGPPVHVLTACNEYRQETLVLERSAAVHGYGFRAVGLRQPWCSLGTKLVLYDRALQELVGREIAPGDPVMLLDAWDTVLLGPAAELRAKLSRLGVLEPGGAVLGAADRLCAPEYKLAPYVERLYPEIETPWRYPNSGGFAGTGEALRDFLHCLVHGPEGGGFTEDGDDQLRVQTFLLDRAARGRRFPLILDSDCRVFQCMGEPECGWDFEPAPSSEARGEAAPRIRNWTTGERPLVAHGCGGHGRWFLADVYRELRLLDFLGLDSSAGAAELAALKHAGLVPPGERVGEEHWVDQPPWEFPFQIFQMIRSMELQKLLQREEEEKWEEEEAGG